MENWESTRSTVDSETRKIYLNTIRKDVRAMRDIVRKQQEKLSKLRDTAFTLANYYMVFQGVILSVIVSSSSALRLKWWIPIFLSWLAAVINLYALSHIASDFIQSQAEQDQNKIVLERLKDLELEVSSESDGDPTIVPVPSVDERKMEKRDFLFTLTRIILSWFPILITYASWETLYHSHA